MLPVASVRAVLIPHTWLGGFCFLSGRGGGRPCRAVGRPNVVGGVRAMAETRAVASIAACLCGCQAAERGLCRGTQELARSWRIA
eukprot:5128168-Prymnesium_polylepis.2